MHGSPVFKTSVNCATSRDGTHLATLVHNKILIRQVRTLHVIHEIIIPSDAAPSVFSLIWAPSSAKILVAAADRLLVYSAFDSSFKAIVKSPASSATRPSHVQFGPSDREVIVVSQFGLRLALINLATSSAIEISNPKFCQPAAATRGLSFRPATNHFALLTRFGGKDCISIYSPDSRTLETSFCPDTIDAQGIAWASNGRWLAVWESPAQGHKVLLYTPDGYLFNTWTGPADDGSEPQHYDIGAGVKHCHVDPSTMKAALCDYTRAITLLDLSDGSQRARLVHPQTVVPVDTLRAWQQQQQQPVDKSTEFLRTIHAFSPPERRALVAPGTEIIPGCLMAEFDSSANLLATVVEEYRSTLWIWDVTEADLCVVVLFNGSISGLSWHPQTPELLLITTAAAEGGPSSAAYVWDPLADGPRAVQLPAQAVLRPGKMAPRLRAHWVANMTEPPVVLVNDGTSGLLVALSEEDGGNGGGEVGNDGLWENASLTAKVLHKPASNMKLVEDVEMTFVDEGTTKLDDTFFFKGAKPDGEGRLKEKPKGNPLLQKAHLRR